MANRKLLGEIDRVLKKVDEGVNVFEQIWDKVYSASTTAQKEKYEADLKKEIKKLQRLRDQIKTWQGDSSVKDKTKLDANRKLIEAKMEKFKVCEKETKTKAFSKEGLAQDRTDPKQKAKGEVGDWVREAIARLEEQSDEFEAEIEQLNSGKRRKRSEEPPRVCELKEHITRHAHHVQQLERVLRAVDNDQVTPEQCNDELRENVDYYLESNQDPDFMEDDEMYDFLDSAAPVVAAAPPAPKEKKEKAQSGKGDSNASSDGHGAKTASQSTSPSAAGVALNVAANAAAAAAAAANAAAAAAATNGGVVSPKASRGGGRGGPDTTSPTRSGAGAKGAAVVSPQHRGGREAALSPTRAGGQQQSRPVQQPMEQQRSAGGGGKAPLLSSVVKGQSAQAQQQLAQQQFGQGMTPTQMQLVRQQQQQQQQQQKKLQEQQQQAIAQQQQHQRQRQAGPGMQQVQMMQRGDSQQLQRQQLKQQQQVSQQDPRQAGSIGAYNAGGDPPLDIPSGPDLPPSAANLSTTSARGMKFDSSSAVTSSATSAPLTGIESELASLETALGVMPEAARPVESGASRGGQSSRNAIASPPSFPQAPASVFDSRAIFEKFDPDTLFFIFYYQQGTYQQYLASRELKRQGWRFHTKYLTWFQRHEEPKVSTDEYETGTFVYFDYANVVYRGQGSGWCQRIKTDFSFEYRYLES